MNGQEQLLAVSKVLKGVTTLAIVRARASDLGLKKFALSSTAWDGVEKLAALLPNLEKPFLAPVEVCLKKCSEAKAKMPKLNAGFKEFGEAAKHITELAKRVDQIIKDDPSLVDGVDEDSLAPHVIFESIADVLSGL